MTIVIDDPLREARRAVQTGRFREARDALSVQAEAVRRAPEWQLLAGMTRWRLGEFAPSRTCAMQARDGFRARGDVDGEMRAENVAAAGAFALGDLAEAERGFGRALTLAGQLTDELMLARCANNLGNVAFYLGADNDALGFYRLAAARFDRVGLSHGLAETWINTGIVWRDLDRLPESQDAAERALEIAEQIGSPRLLAQSLAMRGEAQALLGDLPLGRAQVQRALDLARAQEDRLAEIEALRILCGLEREARRFEMAERYGRDALTLATALMHPWAIAEVQRDRAELYIRSGRRVEATSAFLAAADALDRLGASPRAQRMRDRAGYT